MRFADPAAGAHHLRIGQAARRVHDARVAHAAIAPRDTRHLDRARHIDNARLIDDACAGLHVMVNEGARPTDHLLLDDAARWLLHGDEAWRTGTGTRAALRHRVQLR